MTAGCLYMLLLVTYNVNSGHNHKTIIRQKSSMLDHKLNCISLLYYKFTTPRFDTHNTRFPGHDICNRKAGFARSTQNSFFIFYIHSWTCCLHSMTHCTKPTFRYVLASFAPLAFKQDKLQITSQYSYITAVEMSPYIAVLFSNLL